MEIETFKGTQWQLVKVIPGTPITKEFVECLETLIKAFKMKAEIKIENNTLKVFFYG